MTPDYRVAVFADSLQDFSQWVREHAVDCEVVRRRNGLYLVRDRMGRFIEFSYISDPQKVRGCQADKVFRTELFHTKPMTSRQFQDWRMAEESIRL